MDNVSHFGTYRQVFAVENERFRDLWIRETLKNLASKSKSLKLLDVGAGLSPYKNVILDLGYEYVSHDFSSYAPEKSSQGLQNPTWEYPIHDIGGDILDIPEHLNPDVVLCTEVLEHVPDPVRAFQKISKLLPSGGHLVISVPFLSLMHQAPYWFQSGLSPFWFDYWSQRSQLRAEELLVFGDYSDLMSQEVSRIQSFNRWPKALKSYRSRQLTKRSGIPRELLQAGAFGVLFLGTKKTK